MRHIGAHVGKLMYFESFCYKGELGFLNCDAICMCVVNKQIELLEFVFVYVYVDLQYDEYSLTFTAGSVWYVCPYFGCSDVGVSGWVAWARVWESGVVLYLCVL